MFSGKEKSPKKHHGFFKRTLKKVGEVFHSNDDNKQPANTSDNSIPTSAADAAKSGPSDVSLVDGHGEPQSGATQPPPSLWDQAYRQLNSDDEDAALLKEYEELLDKELSPKDHSNPSGTKPPTKSLAHLDPQQRKLQSEQIIAIAKERMDASKSHFDIAGHEIEFDVKERVKDAVDFILWGKELVSEAVKPSPEASMVWAGVCLVLPLLTHPFLAAESNKSGFSYVTTRMNFYVKMEDLLLGNGSGNATGPEDLTRQQLVSLYALILKFQFTSVIRLLNTAIHRYFSDIRHQDVWTKLRTEIEKTETSLMNDSRFMSLRELKKTADQSLETMKRHLQVEEEILRTNQEQLGIQTEQRDISSQQLLQNEITNQQLSEFIDELDPIDLPNVPIAWYNSEDVTKYPQCEQNTRQHLLTQITEWIDNTDSVPFFWLHGSAGSGKSTISRTLIERLRKSDQIAAGYFFKRGNLERNDTSKFFPTLAKQLLGNLPGFEKALKTYLKNRKGKIKQELNLKEQFEDFIYTPLKQHYISDNPTNLKSKIVIIDALDECVKPEDYITILTSLSKVQRLSNVQLRVFITSRQTSSLQDAFNKLAKSSSYKDYSIDTDRNVIADIAEFLAKEFQRIKERRRIHHPEIWPEPEELTKATLLATTPKSLFIYAATICRLVESGRHGKSPVDRLKSFLSSTNVNAAREDTQLAEMYETTLETAWSSNINEDEKELLQLLLRCIILAATPMSPKSLAELLGEDTNNITYFFLPILGAVLEVPSDPDGPVEIFHKSFSDYLFHDSTTSATSATGVAKFEANVAATQALLTSKCIDRMMGTGETGDGLKGNMCKLDQYDLNRVAIANSTSISDAIPPSLEYACLHWVYHLQQHQISVSTEQCEPQKNKLIQESGKFLYKNFLHWIESLCLLDRVAEGAMSVKMLLNMVSQVRLQPWLHEIANQNQSSPDESLSLARFLQDAENFLLRYGLMISRYPMQLYGCALVFTPVQSEIMRTFRTERLPFIQDTIRIGNGGSKQLQVLKDNLGVVYSVTLSNEMIVSGSNPKRSEDEQGLRFWDPATGTKKLSLNRSSTSVRSVCFSPDYKMLAVATLNVDIELWDIKADNRVNTFTGHKDFVYAVVFSPNGQMLASASEDETIRLWSVSESRRGRVLEGHEASVLSVAFSKNSDRVVSASGDKTLRLWNVADWIEKDTTTNCIRVLKGHEEGVLSVAFSPITDTIASGSSDQTVRLWEANSGQCIHILHLHESVVWSLAFSPTGTTLASGSADSSIVLWDSNAGTRKQILKGHTSTVYSVAFSPDGTTLASGSGDRSIRLWDMAAIDDTHILGTHQGAILSLALSPDKSTVASASEDNTVRLWSVETGSHIHTFEGHRRRVTVVIYSQSGMCLASGSEDGTVRLWEWPRNDNQSNAQNETKRDTKCTLSHATQIEGVAFSSDDKFIVSGDIGKVYLWNTDGICERTMKASGRESTFVESVAISPNGTIVSGWSDGKIRLWHITNFDFSNIIDAKADLDAFDKQRRLGYDWSLFDFARSTAYYYDQLAGAIAFSPDGKTFAVSSVPNKRNDLEVVQFWETLTGHHLGAFVLRSKFRNLGFSEDGSYLRTGRGDFSIAYGDNGWTPESISPMIVIEDDDWIQDGTERLLWLPEDYHATTMAVSGDLVILGHSSGDLSMLKLSVGHA